MINVPMKSSGPLNSQTVMTLNTIRIQGPKSTHNITSVNSAKNDITPPVEPDHVRTSAENTSAPANIVTSSTPVAEKPIPPLSRQIQKGQKAALSENQIPPAKIYAKLGWNVTNAACDVDVSAFLLNNSGKVIGDPWFVFYGQEKSPDGSTVFFHGQGTDREIISIDFTKLNPDVTKIVFVLTIDKAFEKNLNFSMLKDAYVRIMDESDTELVSFKMEEYYSNVTSMMIGEVYQYKGAWKFNAIGNGVAKNLAGLCELYGVEVV